MGLGLSGAFRLRFVSGHGIGFKPFNDTEEYRVYRTPNSLTLQPVLAIRVAQGSNTR